MNPTSNTSPSLSSKAIALTAAGARQAARLASNIAGVALQWSEMKCVAQDAAHEAVEAAERASLMADCAAVASQEDTIRALAADAWAAVQRALEADTRVTLAIGAM
jgi:hypothetical protein